MSEISTCGLPCSEVREVFPSFLTLAATILINHTSRVRNIEAEANLAVELSDTAWDDKKKVSRD